MGMLDPESRKTGRSHPQVSREGTSALTSEALREDGVARRIDEFVEQLLGH
jgi:hypothetical protein